MNKKAIAAALAAALGLSAAAQTAAPVLAAGTTYLVSAETPSGALASEAEIPTNIPGLKLTVGADTYTVKSANVTHNGITYTGYIGGAANPNISSGTGTYYRFAFDTTIEDGTLEVMYKLGGSKVLHIQEDGAEIDGYPFTPAETVVQSSKFNVSGGHTYLVYATGSKLSFYGCTYKVTNKQKDFEEEIQGLSFDLIKGENADEAHIDSDLAPIQAYESQFGSCDVAWTSSNQDVINNGGVISAAAVDTVVDFTGKFSVQEDDSLVQYKKFTLTVLGDSDDAAAVEAAKDALTLGDTSSLKKDITLPSKGRRSTNITWSTSDAGVITADGVVTRAPGEDKTATLTATISRNDASDTKEFAVTVTGYEALTLDSFVFEDKDGNVRFSPVDGGKLKSVFVTSGVKTPVENDRVLVEVIDKNGSTLRSTWASITDEEYDISYEIEAGLEMNASDKFRLTFGNSVSSAVYAQIGMPDLAPKDGATIYAIGDSTASQYQDNNYPRKGWAQMLENYFDTINVNDLALSGRSSLSFKSDANFETYKNNVKAGDYLIIQFGHNDSKNEAERYTDPDADRFTDGSFKKSMMEYIDIARDKGAYPILATSISRRKTSDASLEKYVNAAKELGKEIGIPVLDLYKRTNAYINEVGAENAKDMFNYVKIRDSRFYNYPGFANSGFFATGTTDDTHINIYGADIISQWATEELKELGVPLAEKVNGYKAKFPLPSFADAETMDPSATFYPEGTIPETTQSPEGTAAPTNQPSETAEPDAPSNSWRASKSITPDDVLMNGLTAGENMTFTEQSKTIGEESFTGYVAGASNPSIKDGNITGAGLKFIAPENGTFTVYMEVNAGKKMQILDAAGSVIKEFIPEEKVQTGLSAEVEKGKTYFTYVSGSKARMYGADFSPAEPSETKTPDATDEPQPTQTPDATDEPQSTKTPDATDEPQPTQTPDATQAPAEGKPILSFNAERIAGGAVHAAASAAYGSEAAADGVVILASYDDEGRLYGVKLFDIAKGETPDMTWENLPANVHSFAALWIKDTETLEPVCEAERVAVN